MNSRHARRREFLLESAFGFAGRAHKRQDGTKRDDNEGGRDGFNGVSRQIREHAGAQRSRKRVVLLAVYDMSEPRDAGYVHDQRTENKHRDEQQSLARAADFARGAVNPIGCPTDQEGRDREHPDKSAGRTGDLSDPAGAVH